MKRARSTELIISNRSTSHILGRRRCVSWFPVESSVHALKNWVFDSRACPESRVIAHGVIAWSANAMDSENNCTVDRTRVPFCTTRRSTTYSWFGKSKIIQKFIDSRQNPTTWLFNYGCKCQIFPSKGWNMDVWTFILDLCGSKMHLHRFRGWIQEGALYRPMHWPLMILY